MSRLERKCLLASAALHGLLLFILLVGPAFVMSRRTAPSLPILTVIPAKLVDEVMFGGGNPKAKPSVSPAPIQPPQPQAMPPKPEPMKPPPSPKPRAPERLPDASETPAPEEPPVSPEKPKAAKVPETISSKPLIRVDSKIVVRKAGESASPKPKGRAPSAAGSETPTASQRMAAQKVQSTINGVVSNLSESLSGGTTIDIPGPGGEAYANYTQAVQSLYDQAWIDPEDVTDEQATVRVEVVVARDGKILSDRLVGRSRISVLDKSVQDALDRVRLRGLPPFPEGAKDTQRLFRINFNLKAKRLLG